jgi:hypothetical protein
MLERRAAEAAKQRENDAKARLVKQQMEFREQRRKEEVRPTGFPQASLGAIR